MPKTTTFDVTTRYVELQVNTPARTNLKTTTWDLGAFTLVELQVLWAPGHVALTGVRVKSQAVTLLPWNQPAVFLVGDNERRVFDMGFHLVHPLTIETQNTDNVAHTHYFVAALQDVSLPSDLPPVQQVTVRA